MGRYLRASCAPPCFEHRWNLTDARRECPLWVKSGHSRMADLSALHEPIGEAIGLALDRGIEHLDRVLIVLVREYGAFRVQYEAGRLHLLANGCRLNPMQRLGDRK